MTTFSCALETYVKSVCKRPSDCRDQSTGLVSKSNMSSSHANCIRTAAGLLAEWATSPMFWRRHSVQHKLGSALVELCQLTLAGNLPQKLVFCYQVRSRLLLLFPWEMSVGCIRVRGKWLYFRAGNTPSAARVKMGTNTHL